MASELPSYGYVPSGSGEPVLQSCSSVRARLWAGGTYFRAREPGRAGNRIKIEIIEFALPTLPAADAVCVITNEIVRTDEMITGPAEISVFSNTLSPIQKVVINQLHTSTPAANLYSISLKIAPDAPVITSLGIFNPAAPVSIPGSLVAKVTPTASVFTPADEIIITPRMRVYRLVPITVTVTDQNTGATSTATGWDIADLRAQVNATDPWVEMTPRAEDPPAGGIGIGTTNPYDANDDRKDDTFLSPFGSTYLSGGDGLPDFPDVVYTGPARTLIRVGYGELQNGKFGEVNQVYEWRGDSATEGGWELY